MLFKYIIIKIFNFVTKLLLILYSNLDKILNILKNKFKYLR